MSLPVKRSLHAVVALDFSLRSPGVSVQTFLPGQPSKWIFTGFSATPVSVNPSDRLQIQILRTSKSKPSKNVEKNSTDSKTLEDLQRYKDIVDPICEQVFEPLMQSVDKKNVHVFVESYAFPARSTSGSNYKLHEVCGIMKYQLFNKFGINSLQTISPHTWRSRTILRKNGKPAPRITGKKRQKPGFVEKPAPKEKPNLKFLAYGQFARDFPEADLLSICKRSLGKNNNVPNPVQDIAEAYLIGLAAKQLLSLPVQ